VTQPPLTQGLPWPPPGLLALHGRLWPLARSIGIASTLVIGPLLWYGTAGPSGIDREFATATSLLLVVLIVIGCIRLIGCASSLWMLGNLATGCVHRGYTWRTVIETFADPGRDTGDLIAGSGQYAELASPIRTTARSMRLVRAAFVLLAALLPLGMFLLVALNGPSSGTTLYYVPALVFGPSLLCLMVGGVAAFIERWALRSTAPERDRSLFQPGASSRLVDPWYEALERARGGEGPSRGQRGGSLFGLALGGVSALMLVAVVGIALPLLLVAGTSGMVLGSWSAPSGTTMSRVARAERMRAYAVPLDSSITPLRAGQAVYALSTIQRQSQRSPELLPRVREFGALPTPNDSVFLGSGWSHRLLRLSVLHLAARGLAARERDFLRELAAHPAWEEFEIVARAPRADLPDAMLALPLPPALSPTDLPPFLVNATEFAHANVSRAAWHLASGRRAEAERTLRESVGFGLRLMDNAYVESSVSSGATLVAFARDALIAFYLVTGDTAQASTLLGLPGFAPGRAAPGPTIADRAALLRMLTDPQLPQGVRWELVKQASVSTCGNVRELVFGPSPALRRALDAARTSLVRTPAERELFDVYEGAVERTPPRFRRSMRVALARVPAWLLNKPRIIRCAGLWF